MKKFDKSASELEEICLLAIRRHEGCAGVKKITANFVTDDSKGCNWSILVSDLGSADGHVAHRQAMSVYERLREKYALVVDAPDDAVQH